MFKKVLFIFILVNALFWSLAKHGTHCFVASFMSDYCPKHSVHIGFGLLLFIISVYMAQKSYIDALFV